MMGFILLQVVLGFAKIRIHLAHREEIPVRHALRLLELIGGHLPVALQRVHLSGRPEGLTPPAQCLA